MLAPLLWVLISQLPSETTRTYILLLITKETLIIVQYHLVRGELVTLVLFSGAYMWELRHQYRIYPFALISTSIYFADLNLHLVSSS